MIRILETIYKQTRPKLPFWIGVEFLDLPLLADFDYLVLDTEIGFFNACFRNRSR